MIDDYPPPEYYVSSVDLDFNPTLGETIIGAVALDFEMENPELLTDPAGFKCDTEVSFIFYIHSEVPWEDEEDDMDSGKVGEATIQAAIYLSGEQSMYQEEFDSWNEGEYYDLPEDFIHHLESGILQFLISPIGQILDNSYNGIMPRMRFSIPEDRQENDSDESSEE